MITTLELVVLFLIAVIGHAMALFWIYARKADLPISRRAIYSIDISDRQITREMRNSLNQPIHAASLGLALWFGFFENTSFLSLVYTLVLTTIWTEIWHYASHRAFHLPALHWIHREHHRSHVNSPFSAMSFSLSEKIVFSVGIVGALALADLAISMNFYGIAIWYLAHLTINSVSHANFEPKAGPQPWPMQWLMTTTTYHALHHSRYTGNYGLGTRLLDRLFKTEWQDYDEVYRQVTSGNQPMKHLRERVPATEGRLQENS
jgi:sterol desaturase/sphingolipid hydroxylase (fatty acid hydroxylase superfamily)